MQLSWERRTFDLPFPLRNAKGTWTRRESLLVRVRDEHGLEGSGEASPLPTHSPDDLDTCERELSTIGALRLPDADDLTALHVNVTSPAARFAVETALLDMLARRTGRSLSALLGAAPEATVPLSALVSGPPVPPGFRSYKAKLDGNRPLTDELDRLRTLRRSLPPGASLRLDANGSIPPAQLPTWLDALRDVQPELIEEPVPAAQLSSLDRSPIPLALDESLVTLDAFEPLVARGLVQVLVLKPMLLGGLVRCLQLAERAKRVGAKVLVSHLWDGPTGLASAGALALALAPQSLPAGLAPHAALGPWPRHTLLEFDGATLRRTEVPGLGLRWEAA